MKTDTASRTKEIGTIELDRKMRDHKDLVVIDTLPHKSFCAKHIPGSISIPEIAIKTVITDVLPDKNQQIVVYCAGPDCHSSVRAAETLEEMGYKNVYHFAGGLKEWEKVGFQLAGTGEHVDVDC